MIITLAFLTWNHIDIFGSGLTALMSEAARLQAKGNTVHLLVVDNGSTDGTAEAIEPLPRINFVRNTSNVGSAIARNQFLDFALQANSDYLLMVDGDITILPGSVEPMIEWLKTHPQAGCLGANPYGWTAAPREVTALRLPFQVVELFGCALTQYGVFTRKVIEDIRFDPAYGPGWSAEDNDFAMTMFDQYELRCYVFLHHKYLHQHIHGSIDTLKKTGEDPQRLFLSRVAYTIEKWKDNPTFQDIIHDLKRCRLPKPGA